MIVTLFGIALGVSATGQIEAREDLARIVTGLRAKEGLLSSAIVAVRETYRHYKDEPQSREYSWAFRGTKLLRRDTLPNGNFMFTICDGHQEQVIYANAAKTDITRAQVEVRKPRERGGYSPLYGAFEWEGQPWSKMLSQGSFALESQYDHKEHGKSARVVGRDFKGRLMTVDIAIEKGHLVFAVGVETPIGDGN